MIRVALCLAALAGLGPAAAKVAEAYHLIPGSYVANRGPDGNSIFLDAPKGLILIDTGRHPEHRDKLLAYAKSRGRPIAAIINTHWHYDHTTGNGEILAVYPAAEVVASNAVDGPMYADFMAQSRAGTKAYVASGKATPSQMLEIERALKLMDDPSALRSNKPVVRSGMREIAGRKLDLRLESFAVTEGDVWVYDPKTKTAFVGDLVVAPMPFMDSACPEGWAEALRRISATPWRTLVPGHGEPMNRVQFDAWHQAFTRFTDCGRSEAAISECAAGWVRDAAQFIPEGDEARMLETAEYYAQLRYRLPKEKGRFCPKPPPV
ncbi:MAG TPA: MBL fold metallo-hydrolase [Sphingomicrobium sp.]